MSNLQPSRTGLLALVALLAVVAAHAQEPPRGELYRTVAALDEAFFDAYNRCDLDAVRGFLAEDLEFYHDVDGKLTDREVLVEALRLSRRVIAVDSGVPLPRNLHGLALRAVELIGGPGHYGSFRDYLDAGGIGGVLEDSRVSASVRERSVFWHGCRDITILERHTGTSG